MKKRDYVSLIGSAFLMIVTVLLLFTATIDSKNIKPDTLSTYYNMDDALKPPLLFRKGSYYDEIKLKEIEDGVAIFSIDGKEVKLNRFGNHYFEENNFFITEGKRISVQDIGKRSVYAYVNVDYEFHKSRILIAFATLLITGIFIYVLVRLKNEKVKK